MKLKVLNLFLVGLALVGCAADPATKALETLNKAATEGKFLYGHQDDLVYGHSWKVEDYTGDALERSDVKAACGQYPAIVGFDLGGIELGNEANLDGVNFDLMRRAAQAQVKRGGLVTFSWHPRNIVTGGDSWDVSDSSVVASILPDGAKHVEFVEWLDRAADFLLSLGDIPIIFRPWHENVGSWFWWGGKLCTPEQYRDLYVMTCDYFDSKGLTNVLWVYSPDSNASEVEYFDRYPGDLYVDILGVDHYQYGSLPESKTFYINQLRKELKFMQTFAADHNKLICVSETGYEGIPDPQWWTGTLLPAIKHFPVCYVLTWRNAWDKPTHFYAPYEGSADAKDFNGFAQGERTIMLNSK